jgi:DNA-binding response OmpR family regulator
MKILIVDDDPMIRLLASKALTKSARFQVICASNGVGALDLARRERPALILLDHTMPDESGEDVLRSLRDSADIPDIPVIFFTGKSSPAYVERFRKLGAKGVISKPFDPDGLVDRVMEILATDGHSLDSTGSLPLEAPVADKLVAAFLAEGREWTAWMLDNLSERHDLDRARLLVHRWVGRGGTLGYPGLSVAARRVEERLRDDPGDRTRLREALSVLSELFADPAAARADSPTAQSSAILPATRPLSPEALGVLAGKRIAVIGFEATDADTAVDLFARAGAFGRALDHRDGTKDGERLSVYDLVIRKGGVGVGRGIEAEGSESTRNTQPTLIVGTGADLASGLSDATEFALAPVRAEELILRAHRLLSRSAPHGEQRVVDAANRSVVIADDDPTITTLVGTTLGSYEFDCHTVHTGGDALRLVRQLHPSAVVLDVDMPELNGFEVLAQLKGDEATRSIPVILLTAKQQEADILRGFALGAEEYIVKPFNPMELVARLKRLVKPPQ